MKNANTHSQYDHSITIVMIIFTLVLFSAFQLSAQEVEKNDKKTNETQSIESPNAPPPIEINFKNTLGNSIITITDEGSDKGSITLPKMTSSPSSTLYKLYNENGTLKYNGTAIGSGGGSASEINDLSDAKYDGSSLFLGVGAGTNDDGTTNYNTSVGLNSLYSNTTGEVNTATGGEALYSNTIGSNNTATGPIALYLNSTGNHNTANGYGALNNNTSGNFNTANGSYALVNNGTGNSNTAIGYHAGPVTGALTNTTAIGYDVIPTASNQVRIGNSSVTSIGGYAPWSNLSDGRYKLNVQENVSGLDFIMGLRPVTYNLNVNALTEKLGEDMRIDENGKRTKTELTQEISASRSNQASKRNTGFIAQEVEVLAKKLGYDFSGVEVPENEESMYALRYSEFVVPIVKAMQEQQEMIKNQTTLITEMRKEIDELKKR